MRPRRAAAHKFGDQTLAVPNLFVRVVGTTFDSVIVTNALGWHDHSLMHHFPVFLAVDPLIPIRILAVIALVAVIAAFIYVLRHLKNIERTIMADNLIPAQRGPRNNMVLIVCAVPIVIITLLLFLIVKA